MKRPSIIMDNWAVWRLVWGIPLAVGILCLLIGGLTAAFGALLIASVAGSVLLISIVDATFR